MDTDAIIARKPAVVCVDELAHTNVPGSRHEKRAEDIEEIRRAGIHVITTVNIQHLESLNDEVERITGVRQRETVPDEVVRTADQIQLVDMSPDALRRRMAHGNIYRPEQIDASLTSYFRVGNLTALRELALLWLADRVDDALDDYRRAHRIEAPWPTKERIVVALTGGPESETLLRRGARLAQRAAGSDLLAVHVVTTDGLANPDERRIARAQQLVASLGGTFHSVVGEDVSEAVVDFATGANATMIIVGVSRHGRLRRLFTGTTGDRIASLAGSIDVHLVTHDQIARPGRPRWYLSPLSRSRQVAGLALGVLLPVLLTVVLRTFHDPDQLPLDVLLFLAVTVLVALVGGLLPALLAAVSGFLLMNWFFTPPVGRFTISERTNVVALLVFVAVAVGVATVVDRASRRRLGRGPGPGRGRDHELAVPVGAHRSGHGRGDRRAAPRDVRADVRRPGRARVGRVADGRVAAARRRRAPPTTADTRVQVDDDHVILLCGSPLRASDQRVLEAFAVQTGLVLEYRRLRERDDRAAALERAEATSTAILRAVSHDLRTPLATMRAAVDGLVSGSLDAGRPEGDGRSRRVVDRAARAADRQPARPVAGPDRAAAPGAPGAQPRGGAPARGRRPGRRLARARRVHPDGGHRLRPARAGGRQPGLATRSASPTASRCGCSRTCSPTPWRSWSSTRVPASRRRCGSGCSSRSSASTTPAPAASASAWPSPAVSPRPSAARSPPRTPPAAG